jgi:glyoxylase-like metal-dependent hydrolase (beta-lactamase superfamily II)
MSKIHILDLHFLEEQQTIASFLIETEKGPILVETGPESCWPQLQRQIQQVGFQLKDIKNVLLTHIHFDHAGAAWKMAEAGASIYVHPTGFPHLASPERLWNSAAQIYGGEMKRLWGEMKPIPEAQLNEVGHGENLNFGDITIKALHTPGHAIHHVAWQVDDLVFTGDVAGVKINKGPVVPPCPPPDIHLEDWKKSIHLLRDLKPKKLYLTHFGIIDSPQQHLDELEKILMEWANWIKYHYIQNNDPSFITPLFMAFTENQLRSEGLNKEDIQRYELANPSWMSVAGLMRYWKLYDLGRL